MLTVNELQHAAQRTADEVRQMHNVSGHVAALLEKAGDPTAAARVREVAQRGTTEVLSLVFAGEHKSGKSSLINALLGDSVLDTTPTASTTVMTEIHRGSAEGWFAVIADGDGFARVAIDRDHHVELQTTDAPELDGSPVLWLEIDLDHPLLNAGLAFVDTPSISGGIQSAAAGAVLGRLTTGHALVLVTDASQELTGPELEFVEVAATLCPHQLVVATKVDLYAEWHRIVTINEGHLGAVAGTDVTVLPAAAPLRWAAIRLAEPQLDTESGIPLLAWFIGVTVVTEARLAALRVAAAFTERAAADVVAIAEERLSALAGTTERRALEERLELLGDRIVRLTEERQHGFELQEALGDFVTSVEADLQWRMSAARATIRDRLQELDGPEDWMRFEAELHATWNRLLAEHLAAIPPAVEEVAGRLQEKLDVDIAEVDVRSMSDTAVVGELDQPGRPASFADMSLRIGIGGGASAGAGAANLVGVLGAGAVLSVGTALIGGAVVGTGAYLVSRMLGKRRSKDQWRGIAEREVAEYHESVGGSIQSYSKKIQVEVPIRIRREYARAVEAAGATTKAELDRVAAMLSDAVNRTDEQEEAAKAELSHAELVSSHARRLGLSLNVPGLAGR